MPEQSLIIFGLAVLLAYVYAFVGGFTDAANAIATSVGTRVLSPRQAVIMAGFFNLLGGLTGTAVAVTIGKGLVDPSVLTLLTVVAALLGAMTWSLFTYRLGIPVSETHGLIGGIIGAAIATAGPSAVQWQSLTKVGAAIVVSPTLGFLGGALLLSVILITCRGLPRSKLTPTFNWLQRGSAAYMSYSHGRNDAQKPMGVLAMALALHFGSRDVTVPLWVVVSCASVAALGTACGGWRIIYTLGFRMVKLVPFEGFAAEVSGATVIEIASNMGIPISTTHAITSAILGVGAMRRLSAVRWGVTFEIFASWILTVPATILLSALYMRLLPPIMALLSG